jgi:hydantoinase/carbamoylase family amidase
MRDAMLASGLRIDAIDDAARDPARLLGFVEVHIEQGPVLLDAGLAVGVVSSIAGSIRSLVTVTGLAGHAGTVPMSMRRDAAAAAAEIVLMVERRCSRDAGLVGTVGRLEVPGGAINVIPGRCELSLDIRSGNDSLRDAAVADIETGIASIAARRNVAIEQRRVLEAPAVSCTAAMQEAWCASVQRVTGIAARCLPSGAGHDAMMMAHITDIGMLFVRCGNGGISHHPLEIMSASDADVAARVFEDFLQHMKVSA